MNFNYTVMHITTSHQHHWENKSFASFFQADAEIAKMDCG